LLIIFKKSEVVNKVQLVATSLSEKHRNRVFYAFCTYYHYTMKPPGAPRLPLGEVSPNQRSRVVGARDHGIKFPVIARMENLTDTTCRSIVKKRVSPGLIYHTYSPWCTLSPYSWGPPPYTTCNCNQSKDYCPTAFCFLCASRVKEDNLPVP
jgi:hypothetical protein